MIMKTGLNNKLITAVFFTGALFFGLQADAQRWLKKKKKEAPPIARAATDQIPPYTPAINRLALHETINKEQASLLASDGHTDSVLKVSEDRRINESVTDAATKRVDWAQYEIETDPKIDNRLKAHYLAGLAEILKFVRKGWKQDQVDAAYLPLIISSFRKAVQADKQHQSLVPIIEHMPFDVANTALLPKIFRENPSFDEVKKMMVLKVSQRFPERTLALLKDFPDANFADSLIRVVAPKAPQTIYDFAQANNRLSARIQNIQNDSLIATIVSLARNENKGGQIYMPFLDNIVNGKTTTREVDATKNDAVKYFRLLVKTQMDYTARALNGDTAVGFKILTNRLEQKAKDEFVAKINGLHNSPASVRFSCLQPLTAEELYYVAVLSHGQIYTSSYTSGVYPLMMRKAGNKGDLLLKNLHFDFYRRFISQAAAYNTLKGFLASFSNKEDAGNLMRSFVSGLEKVPGLEDGVDVADSYASIFETLPKLAENMLEDVKNNLERVKSQSDKRGIAIYNILYNLFLSADPSQNIDLTRELGIPPVYTVPFSSLANDKGEIIAQVFFYGDQDGRNIFNGFLNMFGGANWKIDTRNKQWVVIRSAKGKPIAIYANRALDETKGEDDEAQRALGAYLEANNLLPTITIHRGHSYYAPSTIHYMAPSSKLVFLGSCGGFNLIDSVLHKSEDAHIIASKQIGKTSINKPFFLLLTEKLRTGKDIDWIPFWKEFKQKANVEGFEDYIPPYKNLGAIFIKAYKIETGETGY